MDISRPPIWKLYISAKIKWWSLLRNLFHLVRLHPVLQERQPKFSPPIWFPWNYWKDLWRAVARVSVGKGCNHFPGVFIRQTSKDFIHNGPLNIFFHLLQYTDWEHIDDGYLNQKMIGDVVGDFFFVCPCNYFAQQVTVKKLKILKKRLKYGNLKIMQRMPFFPLHLKSSIF